MESPSFFDAANVSGLWPERAGVVAAAASAARNSGSVRAASKDTRKIAAFGIDCQVAFCTPGASLFVPGAAEDTARAVAFLYRNLEVVTELFFSLDTHTVHQVFHPAFWSDQNGNAPAPFTVISAADLANGRYRPRDPHATEYVQKLAAAGKYALTIWPYHALAGGISNALVPALMEASMFHAIARDIPTVFETKGENVLTENYSVLSTEVTVLGGERVGAFNEKLFARLLAFDRVYVFGQAKSHCVLSTLRDIADRAPNRAALSRFHVLCDAMSPVPPPPLDPLPKELDFPAIADAAFADLERRGMVLCRTTDVIE